MQHTYKPEGVCSVAITFELDNGRMRNVEFTGGCSGNLQAIAKLVDGMSTDDVLRKLRGLDCDGRGTSCSDQLSKAVEMALKST